MNSNSFQLVSTSETLQEIPIKPRGRTALISEADIIRIGEQMEADGKKVSGYLIRAVIGGAGRTDRYSEVWSRYLVSRMAAVEESKGEVQPAVVLPGEIRVAIEASQLQIGAVMESLTTVAIKYAQDASIDRIKDADKRAADAEADRVVIQAAGESAMDKAQTEIETITSQLEAAINAAHISEDRAKQAEGVAADRGEKLHAVELAERLAHDEVTQLTTKLGDELARVGALNSSITELRANLTAVEHRGIQAESQATSLQQAVEKLEAEVGTLNSTITDLRPKLAEVERRATSAESQVVACQEIIKKLEADVASGKDAVQQELVRSDAAQHRADDAQARADHANKRADEELARAREVDQKLLVTQARVDEALARANEAEQKLLAENQRTENYLAQLHQLEATVLELNARLASVPATLLESNS